MELSKEYLEEQRDCIVRNNLGYIHNLKDPFTLERLNTIKNFCNCAKTILSVGSGGYEPYYIGATHAVDVHCIAETILREHGWKGVFSVGSCTDIPYGPHEFEVAYCTEVIEHLPTLQDVEKTFRELARVSSLWIVTTPVRDVHEPTHKRIFTEQMLEEILLPLFPVQNIMIERHGLFFYIHNGERKIFN